MESCLKIKIKYRTYFKFSSYYELLLHKLVFGGHAHKIKSFLSYDRTVQIQCVQDHLLAHRKAGPSLNHPRHICLYKALLIRMLLFLTVSLSSVTNPNPPLVAAAKVLTQGRPGHHLKPSQCCAQNHAIRGAGSRGLQVLPVPGIAFHAHRLGNC